MAAWNPGKKFFVDEKGYQSITVNEYKNE